MARENGAVGRSGAKEGREGRRGETAGVSQSTLWPRGNGRADSKQQEGDVGSGGGGGGVWYVVVVV
jgi:hypothetical protein